MNIYIGFTLSPKRYAMRRLKPVLNYFRSFTNDDLITFLPSSNMMVRMALFPTAISVIVPSPKTLCLTLSPMSKFSIYLFLLKYANTTNTAKMIITMMCTGMPNKTHPPITIIKPPKMINAYPIFDYVLIFSTISSTFTAVPLATRNSIPLPLPEISL